MTCLYKGGKGSSCPKTVYRAKTAFQNSAIRHGERLTQYYNTPSCDKKTNFKNRYLDYVLNLATFQHFSNTLYKNLKIKGKTLN